MKEIFRFDLQRFDETTTLKYYDANDSLHTITYGKNSVTVDGSTVAQLQSLNDSDSVLSGWYLLDGEANTLGSSNVSLNDDVHLIIPEDVTLSRKDANDPTYTITGEHSFNVYGAGGINISDNNDSPINVKKFNRYFEDSVAGEYDNTNSRAFIAGSTVEAGDTITNYGQDVVIKVFGGNDYVTNYGSNVSIYGGTGTNSIAIDGGENIFIDAADGANLIYVTSVSSGTAISVSGFGNDDSIQILDEDEDGNPVTVSLGSITAITGGIAAGNVSIYGVDKIFSDTYGWSGNSSSGFVYQNVKTAGAKIDSNTIVYDSLSGTTNYFTVTGMTATTGALVNVDSTDNITDGVTLGSGNVSTSQLSIGGGNYNISLDSGVSISSSVGAYWSVASGNVHYTSDEIFAGFSVSSGSVIPYVSATAATKFTIDGLQLTDSTGSLTSVDGVSLGGSGEITLSGGAFSNVTGDATVNLTGDGYSLKLAESLNTSDSVTVGTAAGWSLVSGTEYAYHKPSYAA